MMSALVRLSIDSSMKFAGPEDLRVDDDVGQPGPHFRERLLDAVRDVESVPPRIFLDDEQQTWPVVDHRVACERHVPLGHVGDLAEADALAVGPLDRHGGQVGRGDDGEDVLDRDALIRGVDESARADDGSGREPEETGVERVGRCLHDLLEGHVVGSHPRRIGQHVQLLEVLPPEGDVRDAGDTQETRPDLPVGDRRELRRVIVFDETPIFITRLVVDVVGMMNGGAAHVGRVGPTVATRSATSWRARKMSVPGLKRSSIDESWGTDFERTRSRAGMPFITCSIGTVTRVSTSAAERPSRSSGSRRAAGRTRGRRQPAWRGASARRRTSSRRRRRARRSEAETRPDDPAHHGRATSSSASSVFFDLAVLDAPELHLPDRHDVGAHRRSTGEDCLPPLTRINFDVLPHVHERLRARVRPRSPFVS